MLIESERLMLTPPTLADAQDVFDRYASDPAMTRYMAWPTHRTVDDTRAFVAFSDHEWRQQSVGPLLIRDRQTHRFLGSTGLARTQPHEAMVGYILARDAWGHGYATEGVVAMIDFARRLGLTRLFAPFHPDNTASRRVLDRSGFTRDPSWSARMPCPNLNDGTPVESECYEYIIAGR